MKLESMAAVGIGAILGAWLRWWLGLRLNELFPVLPLGTLVANLVGGYIIGLAAGLLDVSAAFPVQARLFLMTGFCGGLTTFSTFSAETLALFARGQVLWGFGEIFAHVTGSLLATALGILSIRLLRVSLGGVM